jgi:hypothetical protein
MPRLDGDTFLFGTAMTANSFKVLFEVLFEVLGLSEAGLIEERRRQR